MVMNIVLQIIKKHPVTLFFYILYTLLWVDILRGRIELEAAVKAHDKRVSISWGEGVAITTMFTFLVGMAFLIVIVANAALRSKDQTPFYVWVVAFIIIPMIILAAW